jgi:O-antigen/teichoic acid export membrane protein
MPETISKKEIFLFALRIITLALGQISNILITRVSSVETYSQYVLINSFIMAVCLINQNGLSQVILREIPNFNNERKTIINFIKPVLILSVATSILMVYFLFLFKTEILSALIKNIQIDSTNTAWFFLYCFLWLFCLSLLNIITESFRAFGKVHVSLTFGGIEGIGGYGKGTIINILFILLSVICLIFSKKISILELVSISAVLNFCVLSVAIVFLIRELKIKIQHFRIRANTLIIEANKIKEFGSKYAGIMLYLLCSEILLLINSQSDLWLLNMFSNQINVGFYSVSLRTTGIIITPIYTICSIYISEISKCVSDGNAPDEFSKINRKISLLSIPSILLLLILMFFSGKTLTLIYGSNYQDANLILSILTFRGLVVVIFPALMASLLMVATKQEIFMVTTLGMVLSVLLEYFLLQYFDANGLAIGSVIGYWLEYICAYVLLKNKYALNTMLSLRKGNIVSNSL